MRLDEHHERAQANELPEAERLPDRSTARREVSTPEPSRREGLIADTGMFRRFVEEQPTNRGIANRLWIWVTLAVVVIALAVLILLLVS
jgi:hypothetical protein